MEAGRFSGARGNSRATGLPSSDRRTAAESSAEAPAQPPRANATVMERFRAMLREREEKASGEDAPPSPTAAEIVRFYKEVLAELRFNSKPIITELTIIAGQQIQFAEGIADAICSRVLEVSVDQKLPTLYLLDSIVKNIGHEYLRCFAARLPKVFCVAYNQVHPPQHASMRHLFGTWAPYFPSSTLRKIEDELQFSPSENQISLGISRPSKSPSPRPSHGIHVNPKYLEARRQFEDSAADIQHVRVSSSSKVYGHKASGESADYEFDQSEVRTQRLTMARAGSPVGMQASSVIGKEGRVPYVKSKTSKPNSPLSERFPGIISSGRVPERASPSHPGFGYEPERIADQNGWLTRSWPSFEGSQHLDASMVHKLDNGYGKQRQRDLIDAYGNPRGKGMPPERIQKVQRLDVHGRTNQAATRTWKNSDEEEYDWEDMSPTLADRAGRNIFPPLAPTAPSFSTRVGLNRPNSAVLEPDYKRGNWPTQVHLTGVDEPAFIAEDKIGSLNSGHGAMSIKYPDGIQSQKELPHYQSFHQVGDTGKLPFLFPPSTQQNLSSKSTGGRKVQMPYLVGGVAQSIGQRLPLPHENPPDSDARLSNQAGPLSMSTSIIDMHSSQRSHSPPAQVWPPGIKARPHSSIPVPPYQKQFGNPIDISEPSKSTISQRTQPSFILPSEQYDIRTSNPVKMIQVPHHQSGFTKVHQQNQEQHLASRMRTQEAYGGVTSVLAQPLNHLQPHTVPSVLPSSSGISSVAIHGTLNPSVHIHGGLLPPLPPGSPPSSLQVGSASQNTVSSLSSAPTSAFSGLINSLMAQGLISLTSSVQTPQDTLGVGFDVELIKVRHEFAINSLYSDLPRQCTTCGLRFKHQEEHRSHMDWHVTKNRISKNRKHKPSRKWFVSAKEWLSGAEILGNDVVPGFLPTESVAEKKEDKEMAVPADENQNVCALCAEPFEDFYSDETEEWMYRGAVYLNAPDGLTEGLDSSQLGPIVHAKCRSESSTERTGQV